MPSSYLEALPDILPRKTSRCQDPTAVLIWCHRWIELLLILLLLLFLTLLILKIQSMPSWDALGSSKSKDTLTTITSSQDPTAVLEVLVRCVRLPVTQTVQLWPSKNYPFAKNATRERLSSHRELKNQLSSTNWIRFLSFCENWHNKVDRCLCRRRLHQIQTVGSVFLTPQVL